MGSEVVHSGSGVIESADVVRDLGAMPDAQLSMREHVSLTARACFVHLRRLRSVRRLLGRDITIHLVLVLVFSRLDYCNAVVAGLPAIILWRSYNEFYMPRLGEPSVAHDSRHLILYKHDIDHFC